MVQNKKQKTKIGQIKKLLLHASLLLVFLFAQVGQAASLYPTPANGSYSKGETFSVSVYVSSSDQAMNATSGTLSFPPDKLEVSSVSKSGSIISLWVKEPTYSNSAGTVSFEGIVLNPGYTGSAGKVLTINFKTKAPGSAPITFSSGAILANDGQGTNILSSMGTARFDIEVPVTGPVADASDNPPSSAGTPLAPAIKSDTHPDSDIWYNVDVPNFSWDVPADVSAVRLLVGKSPQAEPTVGYSPVISSRQLETLDDGIWYFHVRLKNSVGWGGISHFRFQIDTQDPKVFDMTKLEEPDLTNPTRSFLFEAEDETSGIDHYEIQLDNGDMLTWQDDGGHIYQTPILGPGRHTMVVKAVDAAGNFLTNFSEFIIDPIKSPEITDYPQQIERQTPYVVRGRSYPNSQVLIWLQREKTDPTNYVVRTNEDGNFTFIADDKLKDGIYEMWAQAVDERGAQSVYTDKYTTIVSKPKYLQIGSFTISLLSVVIPLLALLFFLFVMIWFSWRKIRMLRKRVSREAGEAQMVLHKEFNLLKRRIKKHISLLEKTGQKRSLTAEEDKIVKQFKKDLDYVEEKVGKEIKDIEKEVK